MRCIEPSCRPNLRAVLGTGSPASSPWMRGYALLSSPSKNNECSHLPLFPLEPYLWLLILASFVLQACQGA